MEIKERISRKLRNMKKYYNFLNSYTSISKEDLEKNEVLRYAIERNFHLVIESALDIGEIIISKEEFEKPEEYKNVILLLGKKDIIPKNFSEKFASAASFRNILVHLYEDVDVEKLIIYLKNNLEDFNKFKKYIVKYVENLK